MAQINSKPYTENSKEFYIMPNELHYLLHQMGLTAQEKLIYECLIRYSNNSKNNPFPSYSTLQKFASCGRGTVSKALKTLQEKGLVEVLSRGNNITKQSNIYKINYVYGDLSQDKPHRQQGQGEAPKTKGINTKGINSKALQGNIEGQNFPTSKKSESIQPIPFKRGVHTDIRTSKELEELQKLTADFIDKDYSDFDRLLG